MKFATFYQPLWSLSWLLCMCRLLLSTLSRLVYFPVLLYIITAYSVNEHLSCLVRLAYFTFEILCKTLLPLLVKKSITDWFSPLTLQTSLFKEFILRNVDSAQSILLSLFFSIWSDLLTVNETAKEPPQEEGNHINSPRNLALEATFINHNYSQQCLKMVRNNFEPLSRNLQIQLAIPKTLHTNLNGSKLIFLCCKT